MIKVIYEPVVIKKDKYLAKGFNQDLRGEVNGTQRNIDYSGLNSWSTEDDVVVVKLASRKKGGFTYNVKGVKTPRLKAKVLRAIGGEVFRGKPTQKPQK